jgi:hypothetical protein
MRRTGDRRRAWYQGQSHEPIRINCFAMSLGSDVYRLAALLNGYGGDADRVPRADDGVGRGRGFLDELE